jgi:hypothetical protein
MAISKTRATKPKIAPAKRSANSGSRRTAGKVGKKAADLLRSPVARDLIVAGVVTTVATKMATTSARKAAREELALGSTDGSPGAILRSAVATVASEAVRRMVSKGTKTTPRSKNASPKKAEAPSSATRSKAKKAGSKTSSRTAPRKKRSTSTKAKGN